jgi:predicted nucleotidyltransferase
MKTMYDAVLNKIHAISNDYKNIKMILFGSRSRKDNCESSDYDIAVFSDGLSEIDKAVLFDKIQNVETLKKIDLVFIDDDTDEKLLENIERDGVCLND